MALLVRGRQAFSRGDIPGARRAFSKALSEDPACGAAYLNRAAASLLEGQEQSAWQDCGELSRLGADVLRAYRDLATPSALDYPGLLKAAGKLSRRAPPRAWANVLYAFTLRGLMRYEPALREMDKAVSLQPDSAALWALRSRLKLTVRSGSEGVADIDKALSLEPRCSWLHCWRGEALRHLGKGREALRALNQGLALAPEYQPGYAWRAGVLRLLGRPKQALADLFIALRHDPLQHCEAAPAADQLSWAYNQRMLCWLALGEPMRALRDLNCAHALNPRYEPPVPPANAGRADLQAKAWQGRARQRAGDRAGALRLYQEAIQSYPHGWVWTWAGELLLEMGQASDALRLLDRAVREEKHYAPAWCARARTRLVLGEPRGAYADFTHSVRLDHRSAAAWAGRGECRKILGDRAGAAADARIARGILSPSPA